MRVRLLQLKVPVSKTVNLFEKLSQEGKSIRVLCMKMATQRRVWGGSAAPEAALRVTVYAGKALRWADNMWQHRVPLGEWRSGSGNL